MTNGISIVTGKIWKIDKIQIEIVLEFSDFYLIITITKNQMYLEYKLGTIGSKNKLQYMSNNTNWVFRYRYYCFYQKST